MNFRPYFPLLIFFGLQASAAECPSLLGEAAPSVFQADHFPSSAFGLVHAARPADAKYAEWAATTANEVLQWIQIGTRASKLFEISRVARREFAQLHEGYSGRELEGFGGNREEYSKYVYGEDYMGVSSITYALTPAKPLGPSYAFEKEFWKEISVIPSRIEVANETIRAARLEQKFISNPFPEHLVIDRFYQTLEGEVVKIGGVEFTQAKRGVSDSPYFVRTWNTPVPEINTALRDVFARINLAMRIKGPAAEHQLVIAMYGFFNAMPYYRGSGAIGRIIFSALFTHLKKQTLTMSTAIDVRALILPIDQFMAEYEAGKLLLRGDSL